MKGPMDNPVPPFQEDLDSEAALYALGVLDPQSASRFEDLLAKDPAAVGALSQYYSAAACMAESLTPVAPPAGIKQRLLDTIAAAPPADVRQPGLGSIRKDEGKWRQSGVPGVMYKKLYIDKVAGLITNLVRMEPGATYPAHRHKRTEQCLILEGDLIHDGHVYYPGDFTWAEAGAILPPLQTEKGNLLLIVTEMEEELV